MSKGTVRCAQSHSGFGEVDTSFQALKSGPRSPAEPKEVPQNRTPYNQRDKPPQQRHYLYIHSLFFPLKGADVTAGLAPPAPNAEAFRRR